MLAAKEINPSVKITTRAEYPEGEKRLTRAGADKILSPYLVGGQRIADGLLRPHVVDFLELTSSNSPADLIIEELLIPKESSLCNKTISEAEIASKTNIIIVAVVPPKGGDTIINPPGNTPLTVGSILIGVGAKNSFNALESLLLPKNSPLNNTKRESSDSEVSSKG